MTYEPRIYPLNPNQLTEEQIAVVFAMTSRRPEPFDEIQKVVTEDKAADFHERWVLNYGHSSVAEHAIIHMAVENISRLACDTLEDNRLASYTEKSSRFQVFPHGYYHTPVELDCNPLRHPYIKTCARLFELYHELVENTQIYLRTVRPKKEGERDSTYALQLRREATDSCRFALPAATLTNVGVTMNARVMEHAIRKLLSSDLEEERSLAILLKDQGRRITPTLIRYADYNPYIADTRNVQMNAAQPFSETTPTNSEATLVHYDPGAEAKVAAAFLYRYAHQPYEKLWQHSLDMSSEDRAHIIEKALSSLGPHDIPIRELEVVYYTFDFVLDYGAYREFKRHRMQTYIPQPATVALGYVIPPLLAEAGLTSTFVEAMQISEDGFYKVASEFPRIAEYLVTHAHKRRMLTTMNLRQCYHLFKLRTQPTAHFSLVHVIKQAMEQAQRVHPSLFQHLRLRS